MNKVTGCAWNTSYSDYPGGGPPSGQQIYIELDIRCEPVGGSSRWKAEIFVCNWSDYTYFTGSDTAYVDTLSGFAQVTFDVVIDGVPGKVTVQW